MAIVKLHLTLGWLTLLAGTLSQAVEFPYSLRLDAEAELDWNFNLRENFLAFSLRFPANVRIVGLGFSERGSLANADFGVVTFDSGGRPRVADFRTGRRQLLRRTRGRRYRLADFSSSGGWRHLVLVRPIGADSRGDYAIDRGTTHLLFFKSQFLWGQLSDYDVTVHPVQLLKSQQFVPPPARDTFEMEIRVEKVPVPAVETTYWCRVVELPHMQEKHHIVGYEPVITHSSSGIVHHLEVFLCVDGVSDFARDYNAPCNSETKPKGLTSCRKVIGAWAMGAQGVFFPAEAGLPIGGGSGRQLAVVEIHFNNQQARPGYVDSSGLRFFVSRYLRKYDVGILELGLDYQPNGAIPPGQTHFQLTGFCMPQCTDVALPPTGISVFASQLHTHTTGVSVITRHITRSGRVLTLSEDKHYDPTFQEIRLLPRPVRILPGDSLATTCTYDTRRRRNVTFGGISISNEMCLNYVFYYPKTNLELCKSIVNERTLDNYFARMRRLFGSDTSSKKSLVENFNSIGWGIAESQQLQRLYWEGEIRESCNTSAGAEFPGHSWSRMIPVRVNSS